MIRLARKVINIVFKKDGRIKERVVATRAAKVIM